VFGFGGVEQLVVGTVVVAAIVVARHLSTAQWVRVDRVTPVGVDATALDVPLGRLLGDLPGTRMVAGGPATWTLQVERAQSWTCLPAVLLFPLGLLFLLFKEHGALVVSVRPAAGGAEVRALGTTRLSVHRVLEQAVADLPASDPRTGLPTP